MSLLQNQLDFIDKIETEDRNMYSKIIIKKLVDALKSKYACTALLMGEDLFSSLAYQYATCYPSRSPSLQIYGEYFPIFIKEHVKLPTRLPFYNIAKLESNIILNN